MRGYARGDCVIYRKTKQKSRPARRARNIHLAPKGETYTYDIDKYCCILELNEEGDAVLLTRRGGRLTVAVSNSRLRPARWWERILRAQLFPSWPPQDPNKQPG
jgi:hypothetical protein